MIGTLRNRDFFLAWLGGLVSMMGDWVLFIALPIHIYQLTGSTLATSAMFIAAILPALLLGSVAGVFVDRWDRKRTMLVANLVLAVIVLPLFALGSADWVWVAYVVSFTQSTISQFFRPAENAFLPRLVPEEDLLAANSLNALNNNLARLIGPALGGVLVGRYGLDAVVLVESISFLGAAAMIALIATSGRVESGGVEATAGATGALRNVWREWGEGLALLKHRPGIAALLTIDAVSALGEGVFSVMFVVWVHDVLDGGARELGWLMSAQAVGGILGGILLGSVARRHAPVRVFGIGSIAFGVLDLALFGYPLVFSGIWVGIVLIGLVGIPTIGAGAGFMTLLQQAVEDAYRGRVFGLRGTAAALLQLAGTLLAGVLGNVAGPILLLTVQGGSYILMGALALALLPRLLPGSASQGEAVAATTSGDITSP